MDAQQIRQQARRLELLAKENPRPARDPLRPHARRQRLTEPSETQFAAYGDETHGNT
jgi:hypothetical protein